MAEDNLERIVSYLRIVVILILIALVGLFSVNYILRSSADQLYIRLSSSVLVALAALNLISSRYGKDARWMSYSMFLAAAMLFGSVGDFMMAGLIYLTPDAFINAVIFFGIANVFYVFGLRTISPLLIRRPEIEISAPEPPRLEIILRSLILLFLVVIVTAAAYIFTAINPFDPFLGIAALSCAILLASGLAFALAKSFEDFPLPFKLVIALGFPLLLYSSWVAAVRHIASSDFLSSFVVGLAYVVGLLLIHLSPFLGVSDE